MTSQRLVTKCPLTLHNQGMHHCHYGLGQPCAHMEQVHANFILMPIMQDMILCFYILFRKAVCMYVSFVTLTIILTLQFHSAYPR